MKPEAKELLRSLVASARSDEASRHAEVLKQLQDPNVLTTLDIEAEYLDAAKFRLHVAQVVNALASNPSQSAQDALFGLTKSDIFTAHPARVLTLIRASAQIRPAPGPLVEFWDAYSQPGDGYTPLTVDVLVENGSPAALDLFERKMADPSHEDNDKVGWLRSGVLKHRNDALLLEKCGHLLDGMVSEYLQTELVDILFDYRPDEWFCAGDVPAAPPLQAATQEALSKLVEVGIVALTMIRLSDERRAVVSRRMEEAEKLKASRDEST